MTRVWQELEGAYVGGECRLERHLGNERNSAFFHAKCGDEQRPAAVKLMPEEDAAAAEQQLGLWRRIAGLAHPNLLPLIECGRAELGGGAFLYAVFEEPDDSLVTALANGPLGENDARDVLNAAGPALRYIHQQGMVHTSVDADHIVAVGDRIKLASDTLRNAGDGGVDARDDVRALGALVYEIATGRRIEAGIEPDLSGVSEPLATEIRTALKPAATEPQAAAAKPILPAVAPVALEAKGPKPETPKPEPQKAAAEPVLADEAPASRRVPSLPLVIAGAAAIAIAIVLAATHRSAPDAASTAISPAAAPATAAAPAVQPSAPAPAPSQPAEAPAPAPRAVVTPPAAVSRPSGRGAWRVVAYTYNRRSQAEHKAQTINRRLPGFEANVFAPRGANQPPFFVALGGRMSREEAVALQRRAWAKGLPRDTFVRNFAE